MNEWVEGGPGRSWKRILWGVEFGRTERVRVWKGVGGGGCGA
jgi:hypothetical protein